MPLILTDGASSYLYGPGGIPFEQITTAGAVTYLHADQLGSIRMITTSTGTSAGTASYTAYGTRTTTGTTSPFGYAGQYTDTETGLQWDRARYYDPTTAQFLTVDPLAAVTGARYSYASGNPISQSDPSGAISYGQCINFQIGFWVGYNYTFCGVATFNPETGDVQLGDSATTGDMGDILQSPTLGVSTSQQVSNANQICQLNGPFYYGGASKNIYGPISAGPTLFGGSSSGAPNNFVYGGDVGVGPSLGPVGYEIHGGVSNTTTGTDVRFNAYSLIKNWLPGQVR